MFVISTLKRPVPLEHFLYTGLSGKSKDERFLIVNADGTFVTKGYMAAMEAKKSKEKTDSKPTNAAGPPTKGKGSSAPVQRPTGGGSRSKGVK